MKKLILHPALFVFALFGCDTAADHETSTRIDHVERVFMHKEKEFTLVYRATSGGAILTRKETYTSPVTIMDDVPYGQEMWAEERAVEHVRHCNIDKREVTLVVHVHALDDVAGAPWNRRDEQRPRSGPVEAE